MKRSSVIILTLVSLLLGTAFAQTEDTPAQPDKPAATPRATVGDKFEISVWYSLPSDEARVLESMITEYQDSHPYVKMSSKNFPDSDRLYRALTSGKEVPTVALMESSWLSHVASGGKLMSVEDWMPRDKFLFSWSVKHDVYKALFDASSVGDKLMARPFFFTTKALIYNTEIFKAAGVAAPPTTWQEMAKVSEKIAKPEASLWAFRLAPSSSPRDLAKNLQIFTWQAGSDLVTANGKGSGAGIEKALEFLTSLGKGNNDPDSMFVPDQVAMFPGTVADYLRLRANGVAVKTASLPGPDAKNRTTELQVWSLGMFQVDPEQLYKVQEFAFWLLDFPQQRAWAEQTPYLAAHVKVFDNPFYRRERLAEHSGLRVFVNVLGRSKPVDTAGRANATLDSIGKELPGFLRGEKSVSDLVSSTVSVLH